MAMPNPTLRYTIRVGDLIEYVVERPSDPEARRDFVREFTTATFITIFGLTVLFAFIAVIFYNSLWTSGVKDFIQLILPIETALIGSAVGFYFGTKTTTTTDS